MTQQESIDYNTDLEQLLKLHAEECESLSILHRNSYEKYNGRSNYINIPVIILSSAIGFATGIDIGYEKMNIILGISSIFVGIIKSIDTYFQLGKRAESHRLCSLQFQQINKKIQIELALVRSQRIDAKDMMNIIKTDIKNLFDIAPLIDQDVIESFKKKYGHPVEGTNKVHFDAHTPNLCNGLSIVTINSARNKQDYEERSSRKSSRDGSPSRDNANNHNGGGKTIIIDDAAIALDTQEQLQIQELQQQLQQLQQLQPPPSLDHVVVDINSTPQRPQLYHASAGLVSVHSSRNGSRPLSVHNTVPNSVHNTVPNSVHNSVPNSVHNSVPNSVHNSVPNSVHNSVPNSVHNSVPNSVPNSVHNSVPNSVHNSVPNSVHNSVPNSVHGGSTPMNDNEITIITEITELTDEQLRQLQQLQQAQQLQQILSDLQGEEGEMM